MKRSSIVAGLLTIGLHAIALGCLSLWTVGGGDVAHALDTLPDSETAPAPSAAVPVNQDTASPPMVLPDLTTMGRDTAAATRPEEGPKVKARTAARTEVTPVLMLSWQTGGKRRKTAGLLPTLSGPLAGDVSASFKVMVTPDGKVRSVRAVKGKNATFERAALARIKQWKFEPLRVSGRTSDQLCMVTLRAKARH